MKFHRNCLYLFTSILISTQVAAGCLSNLESSNTVYSKIRGFYLNQDSNGDSSLHYVILDKASCTATESGDAILGSTTKGVHYLAFLASDKTIFSMLLSAQARNEEVEFRLGPTSASTGNANRIAYIISPSKARTQ